MDYLIDPYRPYPVPAPSGIVQTYVAFDATSAGTQTNEEWASLYNMLPAEYRQLTGFATYTGTRDNYAFPGIGATAVALPSAPEFYEYTLEVANPTTDPPVFGRYDMSEGREAAAWIKTPWQIRFTFASAISAFGFYIIDAFDFSADVRIVVSPGTAEQQTFSIRAMTSLLGLEVGNANKAFFGFIDTMTAPRFTVFDILVDQAGSEADFIGIDEMFVARLPAMWSP